MKTFYCPIFLLLMSFAVNAQDSVWTLNRCISHAREHNLSVRQSELDARLAEMTYESSRYSHLPTLSLSSNYGMNFGRSINPTTNQFENTQFSAAGLSASSGVLLFGWFGKRYGIQNNELRYRQSEQQVEQLKDDLILTVATAYLRALLAREQIANLAYQTEPSINNKERVEKLIEAGRSNILELSQTQHQLASDSSLYYQALLIYEQSLIDLKSVLNLDLTTVIIPEMNVTEKELVFLEKLDPEQVYDMAERNFASIMQSELAVAIARKDIRIAKANRLPQLSMHYSTGTNFSNSFYEYLPSGERRLMNFGRQLNTNFSQSVGLGLSFPVFNNFASRDAVRAGRIGLEKATLADDLTRQQLKQEVYKACVDYEITFQKYASAMSAAKHAETAFQAAQTRYETGLIPYFEFLAEKNNFLKSQHELTSAKYDLQFKKIVVEYYTGRGLSALSK